VLRANFGAGVAVSRHTIVVGADGDDDRGRNAGSANFYYPDDCYVSEDDDDYCKTFSNYGAVYIFTRQLAGGWVQTDMIVPTDVQEKDEFGYHVAISTDTVAAIAGRDSPGLAYVDKVCDN